ncbi:MAG TPA: DUF4349 domain-containing protein [Terriglobia bacterium]|nr:DUF4349 domain-containing protein [Terriglobia bacterium]
MTQREHPIWEEELMPYCDGQLDAAKASEIANHLETCDDCAAAVADAKGLSRQMTAWKIEDSSQKMRESILTEMRLQERSKRSRQRWAWWTNRPVWAYGLTGAVAALVLLTVSVPSLLRSREVQTSALNIPLTGVVATQDEPSEIPRPVSAPTRAARAEIQIEAPSGPMIIRSARLTILTKDFEGSRARIEAIARESQGYLDQLTAQGEVGSGRTLSATLRLPSGTTETALVELRKLGKVREESQNSSDVTSQYVDLQARLTNARNTEQRLTDLLRERTGKLPEVVEVEREISRVREEIERMQAQQKDMNNKVQFATIQVSMSEEYRAEIEPSSPSAGTRLRNALIDGYHSAVESVLNAALLVLLFGPVLLLWSAVLIPVILLARRIYRVRLS